MRAAKIDRGRLFSPEDQVSNETTALDTPTIEKVRSLTHRRSQIIQVILVPPHCQHGLCCSVAFPITLGSSLKGNLSPQPQQRASSHFPSFSSFSDSITGSNSALR